MDSGDHRALLGLLDGLVLALTRRDDVVGVVSEAENDEDALRAVCLLLDIGPEPARAVLDLQVHRMTREHTRKIVHERDTLRARVSAIED